MRLTHGEVLQLFRRRIELSQAEFAKELGISEDRLRRWEQDKEPIDDLLFTPAKWDLTPGEVCHVARRRAGFTCAKLARKLGRSRVTLIQLEHDRWNVDYLIRWWAKRGWPSRPALTHAVQLGISTTHWPDGVAKPE